MSLILDCENFLKHPGVLLDSRSPSEYLHAHIPGAINFPLFTDAERALIGTLYKQEGKEVALEKGLELVGPKLSQFLSQAKHLAPQKKIKIHCSRGGMRSESLAWLLSFSGFEVALLRGGYKAFRQMTLKTFSSPFSLNILAGYTGSCKTKILKELKRLGEQVIDLEDLACHRGSSFGKLSEDQPSNEHFENRLAMTLLSLDLKLPIWIEDESRRIGSCLIPEAFFKKMQTAFLYEIQKPKSERLKEILAEYGNCTISVLKEAVLRINRRLGSERTKQILSLLDREELEKAADQLLDYYDQSYQFQLSKRNGSLQRLYQEGIDPSLWAVSIRSLSLQAEWAKEQIAAHAN